MVTIVDVARAAGVSKATISRVLLRPDIVAPATRERVLRVVDRLGYAPNAAAASLRTTKTNRIVITVPNISNPFFARVIQGAEETAQAAGYSVLLGDTKGNRDREEQYANLLHRHEADGLVFLGHRLPASLQQVVERDGIRAPIVNGCEFNPSLGVSSAHIDNAAAAFDAMEALYAAGHRSVAVVAGPKRSPLTQDRLEGARRSAAGRGLTPELQILSGDFSVESGYRSGGVLFARESGRATGVFCFSDEMAIGVLAAARSASLRCPQDVSIVGFDDIRLARYMDPPLTTVRQPMKEIGGATISILLGIIEDRQADRVNVTLAHKLVHRGSLSSPPARLR